MLYMLKIVLFMILEQQSYGQRVALSRWFVAKVTINSKQAKDYALKLLNDCDIESGMQFNLDRFVLSRTAAQNALMWMIFSDMKKTKVNEHAGITKEEWHEFFKEEYLVNIYERDVDVDGGKYAETIRCLRSLYATGMKADAEELYKAVVRLTSTTQANVNQFTEYLNCIMNWCNARGIAYRLPTDIYNKAMGIK